MQVGIPVAYNVCELKLVKINHWICVHIEDSSNVTAVIQPSFVQQSTS